MKTNSGVLRFLVTAGAVVALSAGCVQEAEPDADQQEIAPGAMRLVSREPVTPLPPPNLVANGDFEEWVTGAPAPVHFVPPLDMRGFSAIEREAERVHSGESAVRQTWVKPKDTVDWFYHLFHTAIEGLEPGTRYRLTFSALNATEEPYRVLVIQAWGPKPGGDEGNPEFKILASCDATPGPEFKEAGVSFTTLPKESVSVYLVTGSSASNSKFPATVIWDDFSVTWDDAAEEESTPEDQGS